ncbi:hypothetical protein P20439_1472 [Pseudoalteromonas sp. BSi20439]|nr:hypothetical protein P20439_1472 [Pseudoalteromonas sp. BSi20439]
MFSSVLSPVLTDYGSKIKLVKNMKDSFFYSCLLDEVQT